MPFSLEEISKMMAECFVYAELKPQFCRNEGKLIKSTMPFETLNVDFKGSVAIID